MIYKLSSARLGFRMTRPRNIVVATGAAFYAAALLASPALSFDCAPTQCPQIKSCAEARYKLLVCGHVERDADNDGIPCESLCGSDIGTFEARSLAQWPSGLPFAATARPSEELRIVPPAQAEPTAGSNFTCSGKRRCSQMDTCEEAQFHLESCGVTSLDRDRDGVACNSLCGAGQ